MKKYLLVLFSILSLSYLLATPCPFGSDAYVGQNYLFPNADYLHDALDIHMDSSIPIVAVEAGTSSHPRSRVECANPDALRHVLLRLKVIL